MELCAEAEAVFHSFKLLWSVYCELCWVLLAYVRLGPKERWLQRLSVFWCSPEQCLEAFESDLPFCGVYVWVSVVTGKMYVGSSNDFKQRVYSHVLAVRKQPKQRVHRFMRSFGSHLFIPVPLMACPLGVLRQVEHACVNHMQPGLNREWISVGGDRRKGVRVKVQYKRRLICHRRKHQGPKRKHLCTVQLLPGGLQLPSVDAALQYARQMKLKYFTLRVSPGSIHLPATQGLSSMFDFSLVSVEGCDALQRVMLKECAQLLKRPVASPIVLHVHRLSVVGWQWWAWQRLLEAIRLPCSIRSWYKLDQRSFVRLWRASLLWSNSKERTRLQQLLSKVCQRVHGVNLRLNVVIRVPFGLCHMHQQLVQAARIALHTATHVDLSVRTLWCESIRVVQSQGKSIGQIFCNFRQYCRQLNCSPAGREQLQPYTAAGGLQLPTVDGLVAFRGDDERLPAHIRSITSLHSKFIPLQSGGGQTLLKLAEQFVSVLKSVGVCNVSILSILPWIRSIRRASVPADAMPGAVTMEMVTAVQQQLCPQSGGLVVSVLDKNNGLLYFEDAILYRRRLVSMYVADPKHYQVIPLTEQQLLHSCIQQYKYRKWDKLCEARKSCALGYAQCLPKDKDCSLSRPIVPGFKHPLARLFNMAARGFAYVLMKLRVTHFNLFTTQQFVTSLTACEEDVYSMLSSGDAQCAMISQSDVKDMYTEITHAEIKSCVWEVVQRWLASSQCAVLNVAQSGRCGVTPGYTKNPRIAASMRIECIASILLYELQHAFFHVGCSHIMQQVMGVAMGSKGGPVLAWCVCMINEHRFQASLGRDSRYLRVWRYFDDVWQLLLVPSGEDKETWLQRQVMSLQSDCYPSSLRLIQNSLSTEAEMLACHTSINDEGCLTCIHRSKNAKYLQQGLPPRFATFLPYASGHARRRAVMKNTGLGLLHRMFMDTKPGDVPLLLPVLVCYHVELCSVGYPPSFLLSVFKRFLQHPKVAGCRDWHLLYEQYSHLGQMRQRFRVSSPGSWCQRA